MADESEAPQATKLTKIIEVNKRNINQNVINKSGIVLWEKPTPDNFIGQLKNELFIAESLLRLDSEKPSSNLERGFDLARNYINSLRSRLHMPEIDSDDMEVLLMEESNFNKHYKNLSSLSEVSSVGFSADVLKPVVVMNQDGIPEYILASVAFHELIHQHLETRVRVYSSEEDSNDKEFRVFTESRRSGLKVTKVNRDKEALNDQIETGDLLNELPNYLLQKQYLVDVFRKEEFMEVFSEVVEKRSKILDEYLGEENDYLSVKFEGGKKAVLHKSVVHFDINNEIVLDRLASPYVIMQLASDLNDLCGNIDGKPFWEVLLQAKIDPRIQGILRDKIDSKLGKGFYRKLKAAEHEADEVLDILVEIQSKLYTFDMK